MDSSQGTDVEDFERKTNYKFTCKLEIRNRRFDTKFNLIGKIEEEIHRITRHAAACGDSAHLERCMWQQSVDDQRAKPCASKDDSHVPKSR